MADDADTRLRVTGLSQADASGLRVQVGRAHFPVTTISNEGFVILAQGRPPLRGFADIFQGDTLLRHGLVTCAWQEGNQVGYEFKHAAYAGPVAPDYAPLQ